MSDISIKDLVKNRTAKFIFYRSGVMYYTVTTEDKTYQFPVPLSDIGDSTLGPEEKAILLMRFIRKAIENEELWLVSNS